MITDFSCWVDGDIAHFQKHKKREKIKIYKKRTERKRKVEGPVWKRSKTFTINTKLQWTLRAGEKWTRGKRIWGKNQKEKNLIYTKFSRHPFEIGRPSPPPF